MEGIDKTLLLHAFILIFSLLLRELVISRQF